MGVGEMGVGKMGVGEMGVIRRLNSVSSQCAHGKSSIARKPEVHPKFFKW